MLRFSDKRNQAINKKIADMTINLYNKGLAIKEQEQSGDNDSNDTQINTVSTKDGNKGYRAKKVADVQVVMKKGKDMLKEFMSQSKILDNELNQVVSQFKLNSKKDFYGGAFDGMTNEKLENEQDERDENTADKVTAIKRAEALHEFKQIKTRLTQFASAKKTKTSAEFKTDHEQMKQFKPKGEPTESIEQHTKAMRSLYENEVAVLDHHEQIAVQKQQEEAERQRLIKARKNVLKKLVSLRPTNKNKLTKPFLEKKRSETTSLPGNLKWCAGG